jgi:hypothetical protein
MVGAVTAHLQPDYSSSRRLASFKRIDSIDQAGLTPTSAQNIRENTSSNCRR